MKKIFSILLLALLLGSCVQQKEDSPRSGTVKAPTVKLMSAGPTSSVPSPDNVALTIAWTNEGEVTSNTIEISASTTFENSYSEKMSDGTTERRFTYRELNDILVGNLGMETGRQMPIYIIVWAERGGESACNTPVSVAVTPGTLISAPALSTSASELVLYNSVPTRMAMTLSWARTPDSYINTIEMSSSPEFYLPYSETLKTGVTDRQFTYGELNEILTQSLKYRPEISAPLYIRIATAYESSLAFSNVIKVDVTPDMSGAPSGLGDKLYVSGLTDPWTEFTDYLTLYSAEYQSYGGAYYIKSQYGYRLYPEADWDIYYTRAEGTALEGTLSYLGSGNLWAPTAGVYVMDVSIKGYSYKLTAVSSVGISGISNDWSTIRPMTQTSPTSTVYTAEVTKKGNSTYGFKVIINNNWNLYFGATDGKLLLYQDGTQSGNDVPDGTYIVTVDLAKGTYQYTPKN